MNIASHRAFPLEVGIQTLPTLSSTKSFEITLNDLTSYIGKSVFLLQAWESRFLLLNGAAWSVSALFFFYLTFFYFTSWMMKQKQIVSILICVWVISLLYPVYLIITNNFSSESLGILHRNPLIRLPDFLAGIIFYFICTKYPYNQKLKFPCLFLSFFGFIAIYFIVKLSPNLGYPLAHNGLFLFTQLALIYFFLGIKIERIKLSRLIERLGKASLTIYMLHLPLLTLYFMIYRLLLSALNATSVNEIIMNAKNIKYMNSFSLIIFLIILIPLSLFMQEKIFTPLQIKLNEKMLNRTTRKRINNI